jgi:pyrroloquinoline quinone biosynthesis protein D
VARPLDASLPRLAVGCKWAPPENPEAEFDPTIEATVLFPEGAVRVQGTGRAILELCDGQRSMLEIVAELQKQYILVSPARIREEADQFLEKLQEKRIVDY